MVPANKFLFAKTVPANNLAKKLKHLRNSNISEHMWSDLKYYGPFPLFGTFFLGGGLLPHTMSEFSEEQQASFYSPCKSGIYFDSSSLSFSANFFKLQQKYLYYKNGWPQSLFWMRRDEMIIKSSLDGKGGKTSSARSATLEDTSWARLTTELMRGLRTSLS